MQESRKDIKNKLKKSLLDVLHNNKNEEDFLQELGDVYRNDYLREDSKQ